jgi:hypothetical protein
MSMEFESDSYMGRTSGHMPQRAVYCPACRTEHIAPVTWTARESCPAGGDGGDDCRACDGSGVLVGGDDCLSCP